MTTRPDQSAATTNDDESNHRRARIGAAAPGTLSRRRLLALAGAGIVGGPAVIGGAPSFASRAHAADGQPEGEADLRFAVVTDTHANPEQPARMDLLSVVLASISRREPSFVLNCGDITDFGGRSAYDAYLATIPGDVVDRIRHVPGNHDVRWDAQAAQVYRELFGPAPYSFDAGGLHLVGLDPTQLLQEPANFGPEHLDWLAADLRSAGPSILFLHFPFGADHYYVNDQDAFFETVAGLPVRAVFAGHVHREGVYRFNGFTQVTGAAGRNAVYYWVERHVDDGHPVLEVTSVTVDVAGTETRSELTSIPLSGDGEGRLLAPRKVVIDRAGRDGMTVRVDAGRDARPAVVRAQVYPQHVFGGRSAGTWIDLTAEGRSRWWSGRLDTADLPPGRHRMQLRVVGDDGATYEAAELFETKPADSSAAMPTERWTLRMPGAVQGALAERDGVVVAGSSGGEVAAVDAVRGKVRWRREVGAVYRAAAFSEDGGAVFVPSADHRLYALDAGSGEQLWSADAGDPVLSTPQPATIGQTEAVLFSAGSALHAVTSADGAPVWSSDVGGIFAGRAACDGDLVYTGGGDGHGYAFDAASGERVWSFSVTDRTDQYGRLIYGPWDDTVELLPDGLVMFATVTTTFAVRRETGELSWQISAGCMYPPSFVAEDSLLLVDEWGGIQLVDPRTGEAEWRTELGARALNAGPVVVGDTAWIVATTGLLAGIDLATGEILHRWQVGPANTFSTPVIVDSTLVLGDQDGLLRGIELPG
ncbi:PQQ-binding-like beta-propeller repeat protein [Phytoactinopolyspora alkaliphila]|uniref:PQQ-binding-like beta-propeller repeat protein n=1 Tax=Phytoactinopolyspora alkaliphila TaxID=1783498 RepID=A0A6N9YSR4_9ACTN|nr:PQQ-binding-like beta-propeller repeat protein [Phytoactinopolyspora alkaliphila]NED97977.1 PQQ-binding-like beta-propeller repeat protein [Phytoactinopolyspora alkaliphila]